MLPHSVPQRVPCRQSRLAALCRRPGLQRSSIEPATGLAPRGAVQRRRLAVRAPLSRKLARLVVPRRFAQIPHDELRRLANRLVPASCTGHVFNNCLAAKLVVRAPAMWRQAMRRMRPSGIPNAQSAMGVREITRSAETGAKRECMSRSALRDADEVRIRDMVHGWDLRLGRVGRGRGLVQTTLCYPKMLGH